jgi:hypothetical protein
MKLRVLGHGKSYRCGVGRWQLRCRICRMQPTWAIIPRMEIVVSDTGNSIQEAARLTRGPYWWPRTVLSYAYHTYVIFLPTGFLGYLGARMLVGSIFDPGVKPIAAVVGACLVAIPVALAAWLVEDWRRERRALQLAASGPMRFELTEEGIYAGDREDEGSLCQWSSLVGFFTASRVIVIPERNSPRYLRIPIEALSGERRRELQALLSGHLPDLEADAAAFRLWIKARVGKARCNGGSIGPAPKPVEYPYRPKS